MIISSKRKSQIKKDRKGSVKMLKRTREYVSKCYIQPPVRLKPRIHT